MHKKKVGAIPNSNKLGNTNNNTFIIIRNFNEIFEKLILWCVKSYDIMEDVRSGISCMQITLNLMFNILEYNNGAYAPHLMYNCVHSVFPVRS